MSAVAIFVLGLIVFGAFVTEAAIGFGATVLAVTLGTQLLPIERLLPAFVPVNVLLSLTIVVRHHESIDWRTLLRRMAPPVAGGLVIGTLVFRLGVAPLLQLLFALFVVVLAILELGKIGDVESNAPLSRLQSTLLLSLGGLVHGLFGTGGPMIVYVLRRWVSDKGVFRATLAVTWLVLNVVLLVNFWTLGLFGHPELPRLAGAFLVAQVGALFVGEWVHRRVDTRTFHLAICVLLLVGGLALAGRTAFALWRPA